MANIPYEMNSSVFGQNFEQAFFDSPLNCLTVNSWQYPIFIKVSDPDESSIKNSQSMHLLLLESLFPVCAIALYFGHM
jgi:hypothetical protein